MCEQHTKQAIGNNSILKTIIIRGRGAKKYENDYYLESCQDEDTFLYQERLQLERVKV